MLYGIIGFCLGILVRQILAYLVESSNPNSNSKSKYKNGYQDAVDDMITFCYWRENGGSGARHTGVWFPDD